MVKKTIAMMLVIMLAYTMLPWAGVPTGFTVARAADTTMTIGSWDESKIDEIDTMLELPDSDLSFDDKDVWLSGDFSAGYVLHVEEGAVLNINGTINVPEYISFAITGGGKIVWTGNETDPMFKLSEYVGGDFITLDITIDGGKGTGALISVPHSVSNGWTITVGYAPFESPIYGLTIFKNNRGPAIEVTKGAYPVLRSGIHLHNAEFDGVKAIAAAASGENAPGAINLQIYPDYFTKSTTIDLSGLQRSQIETVYPDYDGGMNLVEGDENSSDPNPQIVTIIPWSGAEKGDLFGEIGDEGAPNGDTKFNYPRLDVEGFKIATEFDVYGGSAFRILLGDKKSDGAPGGNGGHGQSDPDHGESAPVFWPVTVTYGEGGTAWASAETVENGGSVEITAQPYDYNTVADVKVNGESVGAVSSYTIENITGPVAVDVSFRHANSFIDAGGQDERDDSESESGLGWGAGYGSASLLFRDVYPWHPAYSAISFVTDRGIMNGVGGGLFDPDNGVTRAMMATILWRMEGQPAAYGDTGFSDVPAGQWYSQAITWANRAGIIEGYGKGIYGLNDQVTHEQVCAMLYRWHSGGYATVDAAYAWAQSNGMYDGMSAESDEIATRGEIEQLLMAVAVRVW